MPLQPRTPINRATTTAPSTSSTRHVYFLTIVTCLRSYQGAHLAPPATPSRSGAISRPARVSSASLGAAAGAHTSRRYLFFHFPQTWSATNVATLHAYEDHQQPRGERPAERRSIVFIFGVSAPPFRDDGIVIHASKPAGELIANAADVKDEAHRLVTSAI